MSNKKLEELKAKREISEGRLDKPKAKVNYRCMRKEGNKAYHPLLLFKCLLLQKWFHISSDPELEDAINDRESFQTFLGLSSIEATPDHSTFSKFRKRLTKANFELIVGEILNQFSDQGLRINEGVTIDARIVKSAGRPASNKTLEKRKAKRQTPEGKLDKNGNPLKFPEILNQTG
jgi:transposase, IS5 family